MKKKKIKQSPLSLILILSPFKVFSLKKLTSIFASFSPTSSNTSFQTSTISNFSCLLTSALNLPSNSATASFIFSKSFSLSYISCSAINSSIISNTLLLLILFFYSEFFQIFILQLHILLLVSLFLPSVPPLVSYLTDIHN